jgi:hypothetical protein
VKNTALLSKRWRKGMQPMKLFSSCKLLSIKVVQDNPPCEKYRTQRRGMQPTKLLVSSQLLLHKDINPETFPLKTSLTISYRERRDGFPSRPAWQKWGRDNPPERGRRTISPENAARQRCCRRWSSYESYPPTHLGLLEFYYKALKLTKFVVQYQFKKISYGAGFNNCRVFT